MPYCTDHGFQQGKHCSQCGAPLSESPPASGDRIQWHSPEATATVNITQEPRTRSRPSEVECPRCGHFNAVRNTFNCKGGCGQQNLCRRHFDNDYEVCVDCARTLSGEAEAEAERQAQMQADLASWRQRAEQAEVQADELSRKGSETQEALEEAYSDLAAEQERTSGLTLELDTVRKQARQVAARVQTLETQLAQLQSERNQAQERVRALEDDLVQRRQELEQARARIAELERQLHQARAERQQAQAEVKTLQAEQAQARQRISVLEPDLARWRGRAEQAEGQLVAIQRATEEAEEALKSKPIWQQIGIDLVRVPAGEFLMGSDHSMDKDALREEQPQHRLFLPEFYIARTPVTNEQFETFVRATGYKTEAERANAAYTWRTPQGPGSYIREKAQHPVVYVTWYDAQAFCQWAGGRLPTEAEWEKATRGADGRLYPWGNSAPTPKLCNYGESGIGATTLVGRYPAGASPYGLLDVAGNVWEWCSSLVKGNYPYAGKDGREDLKASGTRAIRGGSWANSGTSVRCARRNSYFPDLGGVSIGFRVARGSLI